MALIKCHECGNKVSTEAASCPNCGAGVRQPESPPKKRGLTFGAKIGLSLLSLWIVISALNSCDRDKRVEEEAARVAALTPEQRAAEQKAAAEAEKKKADDEKKSTARFAIASAAATTIKSAIRDPDSLKFDSMRVNDDATVVCSEYRARNGFGGMNREFIVFVNGTPKHDPKSWNKNCTGKMHDLLYAIN